MKLFVIADDLTGANATSVLLSKSGYKCASYIDSNLITQNVMDSYDVIAVSTDSRGITSDEAYSKVQREVKRVEDENCIITKRIDSTLRGNIGSEVDAVLDNVDNSIAVVVASYPDSGRISIGGFLLVDSMPLEKTLVARDPKCPITQSRVKDIIQKQTKHQIGEIDMQEVLKGKDSLRDKMQDLISQGNRVLIVDAVTNEEIDIIAKASSELNHNIVPVDPGPYTKSLMSIVHEELPIELGKKVFFAIGSVSKTTINQIEYLSTMKNTKIIKVDPMNLIIKENREAEINKVLGEIEATLDIANIEILGIATTTKEDEVLNLKELATHLNLGEEEISVLINKGLAQITELAIEASSSAIGAVYTSGGDVTIEVMKKLEVEGIDIKDEVVPLAVYGRFIGGKYPNMPAITKGGLIGDEKTLSECMNYLQTKVSTLYYLK